MHQNKLLMEWIERQDKKTEETKTRNLERERLDKERRELWEIANTPTEEDILLACRTIQNGWSEATAYKRLHGLPDDAVIVNREIAETQTLHNPLYDWRRRTPYDYYAEQMCDSEYWQDLHRNE